VHCVVAPLVPKPSTSRQRRQAPAAIAVIGAFGFLGRKVVAALEADPKVERIVALDVRDARALVPSGTDDWSLLSQHPKLSVHAIDLTGEGVVTDLADIFRREHVSTVFHLALLSTPTHALEMAHELETIGTQHVLHAVGLADIGQLIGISSTMCYGASHHNPAYIRESQPLQPPATRSLRDKADADRQLLAFATRTPQCAVAVARLGAMLPTAPDHFWTRTLSRRFIPAVPGYDPLLQLLHPDDAINGLLALWQAKARGAFHVVGQGVLPLSHLIAQRQALPAYLPSGIGSTLLSALWSAQLIHMPPAYLPYFQWSFVCDDDNMRKTTGFVAQHDIRTVLHTLASS
jgi:UDP-glucose 4-epimerase